MIPKTLNAITEEDLQALITNGVAEGRSLGVVQVRELQDDLATDWPSVLIAHMSGLHAADMHDRRATGHLALASA